MISPLRKVNSDEKKHQSKQNQSDTPRRFADIFDEACEREESKQQNIHILTSGYTRNALPYYNFINMREYC